MRRIEKDNDGKQNRQCLNNLGSELHRSQKYQSESNGKSIDESQYQTQKRGSLFKFTERSQNQINFESKKVSSNSIVNERSSDEKYQKLKQITSKVNIKSNLQQQVQNFFILSDQINKSNDTYVKSVVDKQDIKSNQKKIISQIIKQNSNPQSGLFESYLEIKQVESKEIPISKIIRLQQKQKTNQKINITEKTNDIVNLNKMKQSFSFLQNMSPIINKIFIFEKPCVLEGKFIDKSMLTITINDLTKNIQQYFSYQSNKIKQNHLKQSIVHQHIPLSHCQSKISHDNNVFSIDQNQPIPRQSISLFSRMMKPNLLQVHNKNTQKQKNHKNVLQNHITKLQKVYINLQEILHNILSSDFTQSQKLNEFKSLLSFLLEIKRIQNIQKDKKQSNQILQIDKKIDISPRMVHLQGRNESQGEDVEWNSKYITSRNIQSNIFKKNESLQIKNYDLNQISLSKDQITLFVESLILYHAMIGQILIISHNILPRDQYEQIKSLVSYKSKQTNFCSFPSINSKSMFSFPSIQIKQKSFSENSIKKNKSQIHKNYELEIFNVQQLLVNKIYQNKTQLKRKKHNHTQQYQKDMMIDKTKILQFMNLLYDVWLCQTVNNNKFKGDIGQYMNQSNNQLIFSNIYELIASDQQGVLFLLFVLKQLQYNLHFNLHQQNSNICSNENSNQKINKKSLKNSQIHFNQQNHMKKSFINEKQKDQQEKTKRMNVQKVQSKVNQLQETRNKCFIVQDCQQNQNNSQLVYESKQIKKLKSKQNSCSKLALSRLYQSKLNNIMRKTQKINQKVSENHLKLNKTPSQSKLKNQIHQNSQVHMKSKQILMRSKNPNHHQQHLNILQLKQTLLQKNIQLEQNQKLIKKLMFMQQIKQIDTTADKKNLQLIYTNKIQNIKNIYKQKLRSKQQEIQSTKLNLQQKNSYLSQVAKQRKIQAKLLSESNQLYILKKYTIPNKDKQITKTKYSKSLANLKKGCYKEVYISKNKQNIQELSNITQREQSMSVLRISQQKSLPPKPQIKSQFILAKLNSLQEKINLKNKPLKPKFFSQS